MIILLDTIRDAFKKLIEYFKNMEKGRRNRFLILVAIGLVVIVGVSVFLSRTTYSVLYSGMQAEDAGQIMTRLTEMGVTAKAQGTDTILVDSRVVDNVRMQLASEGMPNSGFNFDIYANSQGMSSTERDRDFYMQAQAQENLRKFINSFQNVENCSVIINFASESVFVLPQDSKPATAVVALQMKDDKELQDWEVRAIYEVVSKAVQGLDISQVRIIDTKMRLYEIKDEEEYSAANLTEQLALQKRMQEQLQEQVLNMLTPVFGKSRVLVEVGLTLNFDQESTQAVVFEPPVEGSDSGLAVAIKELAETVRSDGDGEVAGFDANGAASQYQEVSTDPDAYYSQVSREANLEINEARTQIERAKGRIEKLSVAVILDSSDEEEEDYTEQVKSLVAKSIGVNEALVSVERLPIREAAEASGEAEDLLALQAERDRAQQRAWYIRAAIIAAAVIISLVIVWLIIRTLRKPKEPEYSEEESEGIDLLADEDLMPTDEALAFIEKEDASLAALEEYIDKSPESVAQLLRNWLSDDGR